MAQPTSALWQRQGVSQLNSHTTLFPQSNIKGNSSFFSRTMLKNTLIPELLFKKLNSQRLSDERFFFFKQRALGITWVKNYSSLTVVKLENSISGKSLRRFLYLLWLDKSFEINDIDSSVTKRTLIDFEETKRKIKNIDNTKVSILSSSYKKYLESSNSNIKFLWNLYLGYKTNKVDVQTVWLSDSSSSCIRRLHLGFIGDWYGFNRYDSPRLDLIVSGLMRGGLRVCHIKLLGRKSTVYDIFSSDYINSKSNDHSDN